MTDAARPLLRGYTVDAPSSRDLDDGFWVQKLPDGWEVQVSIADVASAVLKGSDEDRAAFDQCFTKYRHWGNIPMLPRELADDVLSLLPEQTRKTLTFTIHLDQELKVRNVRVDRTSFMPEERMSFERVDEILENTAHERHPWWSDCFALAQSLHMKRREQGALVLFDLGQGLMTNEEGAIIRIPEGKYYRAYLIVQEMMVLANFAVSHELRQQGIPLLYRNHVISGGDELRAHYVQALREVLSQEADPEEVQRLCKSSRGIARAAEYGITCRGHFGLNLPAYAHLTSPIRRYPDLVNQRILHAWLQGEQLPYAEKDLQSIADHLNRAYRLQRERKSDVLRMRVIDKLQTLNEQLLAELLRTHLTFFLEKLFDNTISLTDMRACAIGQCMSDDTAGTADIARILFAKTEHPLWLQLKENALQWLRNHTHEVQQILTEGHKRYGVPLAQDMDITCTASGKSHAPQFKVTVAAEYDGQRYQSDAFPAEKRRDAEQKAFFSLITKIVGLPGIHKEDIDSMNETQELQNPKGRLLEACQRHGLAAPDYRHSQSGEPHRPTFTCIAALVFEGIEHQSDPQTATSKKKAEQLASADLLSRLPTALHSPQQESVTSSEQNPIGALQEWCQKNLHGLPNYSFKQSGSDNTAVFACTCTIEIDGTERFWTGTGGNKKAAKADAARKAVEDLIS